MSARLSDGQEIDFAVQKQWYVERRHFCFKQISGGEPERRGGVDGTLRHVPVEAELREGLVLHGGGAHLHPAKLSAQYQDGRDCVLLRSGKCEQYVNVWVG